MAGRYKFRKFIISRGLLVGEQGLKMNLNSINIYTQGMTLGENLSESKFEQENNYDERLIPLEFKRRPMSFEFDRTKNDNNNNYILKKDKLMIFFFPRAVIINFI